MPFFQGKIKQSRPVLPDCRNCGALATCKHGKLVTRDATASTVIVIDSPAEDSPNALDPGTRDSLYPRLRSLFDRVGASFGSVTVVPAKACATAGKGAWKHCQPLLISELKRLNPQKIIPVGYESMVSVIQWLWESEVGDKYERFFGAKIPSRTLNAWVCPVAPIKRKLNAEVSDIWLYRHMREAMALQGRPYDKVPVYDPEVTADPQRIAEVLGLASQTLSAFDYETTGLKPDWPGHEIYTMGISWLEGETPNAAAFRVTPEIIPAIQKYLTSDGWKIATNMKFEDRWSYAKFGVQVKNWLWDTMIAAHWEDPQPRITGLKHQAFVRMGLPYFAHEVEKYFECGGTKEHNNIKMAPMHALLKYNGIDAIAELDLGILQMRENGLTKRYNSINLPKGK